MEIEVALPSGDTDSETRLLALQFRHLRCKFGVMTIRRTDQIEDFVTLSCSCGLFLSFPQVGGAALVIEKASIDGQLLLLPAETYESNNRGPIRIVPRVDG